MPSGQPLNVLAPSKRARLTEQSMRVERALLEMKKKRAALKAIEKARKQKLFRAWKPLYDEWILHAMRDRTSNDTVAAWVSADTGMACTPEDILQRRNWLKSQRPKRSRPGY